MLSEEDKEYFKRKYQRRVEALRFWKISRAIRLELWAPEVAEAEIINAKRVEGGSFWYYERLEMLQKLNHERYGEEE